MMNVNSGSEAIPLVDLRAQHEAIREELHAALERVLGSSRFIGGEEVSAFEAEFASYCGTSYCIGTASGTAALSLALEACGIGPGDEVITSAHTFVATAEAIEHVGARPVLVDVDPATRTIDPAKLRLAISGRTKAVIPVHLYGHPAELGEIQNICERYGLLLIEDAAQAHGALYNGRRVGSVGRVGCFSFYPGKNLGALGDAGAIVTDDAAIAAKVRMLADHGRPAGSKYEHACVGYNARLDALQAAVLRVKLRHLDSWNARRREVASLYGKLLAGQVLTPLAASWAEPVYHLYVVEVPPEAREHVRSQLSRVGVATGIHYPLPVHLQPAFAHLGYRAGAFPVAERLCQRVLSLPMYPELRVEQVHYIAQALLKALDSVPEHGRA